MTKPSQSVLTVKNHNHQGYPRWVSKRPAMQRIVKDSSSERNGYQLDPEFLLPTARCIASRLSSQAQPLVNHAFPNGRFELIPTASGFEAVATSIRLSRYSMRDPEPRPSALARLARDLGLVPSPTPLGLPIPNVSNFNLDSYDYTAQKLSQVLQAWSAECGHPFRLGIVIEGTEPSQHTTPGSNTIRYSSIFSQNDDAIESHFRYDTCNNPSGKGDKDDKTSLPSRLQISNSSSVINDASQQSGRKHRAGQKLQRRKEIKGFRSKKQKNRPLRNSSCIKGLPKTFAFAKTLQNSPHQFLKPRRTSLSPFGVTKSNRHNQPRMTAKPANKANERGFLRKLSMVVEEWLKRANGGSMGIVTGEPLGEYRNESSASVCDR